MLKLIFIFSRTLDIVGAQYKPVKQIKMSSLSLTLYVELFWDTMQTHLAPSLRRKKEVSYKKIWGNVKEKPKSKESQVLPGDPLKISPTEPPIKSTKRVVTFTSLKIKEGGHILSFSIFLLLSSSSWNVFKVIKVHLLYRHWQKAVLKTPSSQVCPQTLLRMSSVFAAWKNTNSLGSQCLLYS